MKRKNFKIICLILAVIMIGLVATPVFAVEDKIYAPEVAMDALMRSDNFVVERYDSIENKIYAPEVAMDALMRSDNFFAERDNYGVLTQSVSSAEYCPTCGRNSAVGYGWYYVEDGCLVHWYRTYYCDTGFCPGFIVYNDTEVLHNVPGGGGGYCVKCGIYVWG